MTDEKTEAPESGPPTQKKDTESRPPVSVQGDSEVPSTGRRAAFRDVRRQLTDQELSSSGAQKLILEMLQEADDEREYLHSFVNLYHESDKKAAVLAEKLLTQKSIEIFFGIGVGLGGTIIGLAPFYWTYRPEYGVITGLIGFCLLIGATIGRIVKK